MMNIYLIQVKCNECISMELSILNHCKQGCDPALYVAKLMIVLLYRSLIYMLIH